MLPESLTEHQRRSLNLVGNPLAHLRIGHLKEPPATLQDRRAPRPSVERYSGIANSSEVDMSLSCWQMRMTACLFLLLQGCSVQDETWMGLEVEPESRCSAYNRTPDYRYSRYLEPAIAARMGGIRCRYTGRLYRSFQQTDIEHMVALSEAHDSGLCAADAATRQKVRQRPVESDPL